MILERIKKEIKDALDNENNGYLIQVLNSIKYDEELLVDLFNSKLRSGVPTTPLIYAVKRGNFEAVRLFIELGANVNLKSTRGNTALYFAVFNGEIEIIKLLIEAGADINATNAAGISILDKAIEMNYDEIIQLLINRGAREKPKNIFHAVVKDNHLQIPPEELERLLVKQWIDLYEVDDSEYKRHNILTHLLDVGNEKVLWDPRQGFNREPREKEEMIEKLRRILEILIRYGVDVNFRTTDGLSALSYLLMNFPIEINEVLIPMLLDADAYLTVEEARFPDTMKAILEVTQRIGREIPVKGIENKEDLKVSAVKLATEEFSSRKTKQRRIDEVIRVLNDAHDRFDQSFMPLDSIIEELLLMRKLRYQMIELMKLNLKAE